MNRMGILTKVAAFLVALFGFAGICLAENLTLTVLDVGQADSILIETGAKRVLIDAGEKPGDVISQLREKGISNIDLLIGTHPHADHIGGMQNVVENIDVKVYMDNGFPHTSATYTKLMEAVEAKVSSGRTRYMTARRGQRLNFGPEAHFEVLFPEDKPLEGTRSDLNSNSIILKLVHGDVCFALMGDAEEDTERAVMNQMGQCQVLKVSHHGSRHSSVAPFLDIVRPKIALISDGLANKHGHPGQETLDRLAAHGTEVYRTDLMGELKVVSDGHTVRVTTAHPAIAIQKLNVNLVTAKELEALPGIGTKTANAIIAYREANGNYATVEDVLKASPKQKSRLEKVLPFLTTEGTNTSGIVAPAGQAPAPVQNAAPVAQQPAVQTAPSSAIVNINTADETALMRMPGMNQTRAQKAIEFRQANGPFKTCRDLMLVKGIGVKTVEKLLPVCTVE